ncbi:MAG: hypothetical protein ACHQJX_08515 [Candidatus Acidiferrales bacterium]
MAKRYGYVVCFFLLAALPLVAQAPALSDMYAQIRAEETNDSKIMWIIHEVADVYGPRVTGTPNLKAADDWAVRTMTSWGLKNAHLEPWTFQPPTAATPVPGWENMELSAEAVSPFHGQLMVEPLAWTPSTQGTVTASVVMLVPPGLAAGGGFGGRPGAAAPAAPSWAPPPMPQPQKEERPQQPTRAELDAYLNSMKDKVRWAIVLEGNHVEEPE